MTVNLMHQLITSTDFIFQELTDDYSSKDIGNLFWKFIKSKFLDDTTRKVKVFDFCYDIILHLDSDYYQKKYNIKISNIRKSKEQITFCAEMLAKMIKHSNIELIDW